MFTRTLLYNTCFTQLIPTCIFILGLGSHISHAIGPDPQSNDFTKLDTVSRLDELLLWYAKHRSKTEPGLRAKKRGGGAA